MKDNKIKILSKLIEDSNNIVFFGGAGVSTESGIPDFRGQDGLYKQKYKYPPEEILSHHFWKEHPEEFYEFYHEKMNFLRYAPNITHMKLALLEKEKKLKAIITQNIDGLHQKAGSKKVLELHGSIHRNYCVECGRKHTADYVLYSKGIPKCERIRCFGTVRPDVVLYEEGLDENIVSEAIRCISNADLLIVAGTSLTVQPAAGLINYFRGENLVLINKNSTPMDNRADLIINEPLGEVFREI